MAVPTPHNSAALGQIAKTVLMPGDPLRAKFIAENFLTDPKLVNNVRGIGGYTGTWKGTPVTVMASGMGMPSMGIYSYELYHFYDVDNILRIGSAGALADEIQLMDIVIGMGACTDSNYVNQYRLGGHYAPIPSWKILRAAVETAAELGIEPKVGNVLSSDVFYHDDPGYNDGWRKMGVLAVEMESAALYMNAARAGKNALGIFTVSDHIYRGESLPAEARQSSFTQMMELALDTAKRLDASGR